MRAIAYLVGGLAVLVGSFLITNWVLSQNDDLNWKFTDEASLVAAATAAGFSQSPNIHGGVDNITRIDGEKVRISGWAADFSSEGSPIAVKVFVNGRSVVSVRTNGPRPDITAGIKATPKANPNSAKNTVYGASFSCKIGDKFLIVATTATKGYGLLTPQPLICP